MHIYIIHKLFHVIQAAHVLHAKTLAPFDACMRCNMHIYTDTHTHTSTVTHTSSYVLSI